jgi:hypothetical protein
MLHKLEPRMQLYAKKLRQMYYREGTIQTEKTFIDPLRLRETSDTLESCIENKIIPGVIRSRDEF